MMQNNSTFLVCIELKMPMADCFVERAVSSAPQILACHQPASDEFSRALIYDPLTACSEMWPLNVRLALQYSVLSTLT